MSWLALPTRFLAVQVYKPASLLWVEVIAKVPLAKIRIWAPSITGLLSLSQVTSGCGCPSATHSRLTGCPSTEVYSIRGTLSTGGTRKNKKKMETHHLLHSSTFWETEHVWWAAYSERKHRKQTRRSCRDTCFRNISISVCIYCMKLTHFHRKPHFLSDWKFILPCSTSLVLPTATPASFFARHWYIPASPSVTRENFRAPFESTDSLWPESNHMTQIFGVTSTVWATDSRQWMIMKLLLGKRNSTEILPVLMWSSPINNNKCHHLLLWEHPLFARWWTAWGNLEPHTAEQSHDATPLVPPLPSA